MVRSSQHIENGFQFPRKLSQILKKPRKTSGESIEFPLVERRPASYIFGSFVGETKGKVNEELTTPAPSHRLQRTRSHPLHFDIVIS